MTTLETHTVFPTDHTGPQDVEKRSTIYKLPHLLGEILQCAITAATFVGSCHEKMANI
jgi:hypothetical protein